MKPFHAFISHKNDCKPWVRTLAKNLDAQGFAIFLDENEIKPGDSWVPILSEGIRQSSSGILVVTANALDSGWVRLEYEEMLIRRQKDPDFRIIPLLLANPEPGFPFLDTIQWIDFSDPGKYKHSFYRLVCALGHKEPGPVPVFTGTVEIPRETPGPAAKPGLDETAFVEELFKKLFSSHTLVLLTRGNHRLTPAKELILEKAGRLFGADNVRHLAPAYGADVDKKEYFSLLSQQCGITPAAHSAAALQTGVEELLADHRELFLLISRFEHSSRESREETAALLRGLGERFPRSLYTVICGGEQLYELAFTGTLSYLNQAQVMEWPEMTEAEIIRIAASDPCGNPDAGTVLTKITEETARTFLEFSGGHPGILDTCFELYSRDPGFTRDDLIAKLATSTFLWQVMVPLLRDAAKKEKIRGLLEKNDVGEFQPYLHDSLLKELYWKNLLRKDKSGKRLIWRSDALRLAMRSIM